MKVQGSLVFYIGNTEVKGGIVSYDKKGKPHIVSTRIRNLPYYADRSREHLESRILHELSELVTEMKTKDVTTPAGSKVRIHDALVILASPWYVTETSLVKMQEQKQFVVTEKFLESSKEQITKAYRDSHEVDIALVEQRILQISLNGYRTANPYKKKANSLEMSVFTSFSHQSSLDRIKKAIDSQFHVNEIKIHSHSIIAFTALSEIASNINQYILADITSKLTELVAVKKGYLAEAASFPKGKNFILETIAQDLGVTEEVAGTFLRNKNLGILESDLNDKIRCSLDKARIGWLADFTNALGALSAGASLPKQFFLFASRDSGHIFSDFIASESYQQFTFAEGVFEVKLITAIDFKDMYTLESGLTADTSIVMGALFRNL